MKQLRVLTIAFALTACTAASIAFAGGDKCATASASSVTKAVDACCASKGKTTATTASASVKNSATTASTDHCAAMKNSTTATTAGAGCSMKKHSTTAMAAGAKCSAHGSSSAMAHGDCSACEDVSMCEEEVRSTGARSKVVALKNGVMVVYSADTPENVRALQTAVSRRNEQMLVSMKGNTAAKLCDDCRSMRGAMASGKLNREVVNVESGCMTLITSSDRTVVQKIHARAGAQLAAQVKS